MITNARNSLSSVVVRHQVITNATMSAEMSAMGRERKSGRRPKPDVGRFTRKRTSRRSEKEWFRDV